EQGAAGRADGRVPPGRAAKRFGAGRGRGGGGRGGALPPAVGDRAGDRGRDAQASLPRDDGIGAARCGEGDREAGPGGALSAARTSPGAGQVRRLALFVLLGAALALLAVAGGNLGIPPVVITREGEQKIVLFYGQVRGRAKAGTPAA